MSLPLKDFLGRNIEPESATAFTPPGPPKKMRKIGLCLAIIAIVSGVIIGFSIYLSQGSKQKTAGSPVSPLPAVAPIDYPAPEENVNPPGTVSSIICPCGYTDRQTGEHYNFATDIDFSTLTRLNQQGISHG
jgi:hypothetical protein